MKTAVPLYSATTADLLLHRSSPGSRLCHSSAVSAGCGYSRICLAVCLCD